MALTAAERKRKQRQSEAKRLVELGAENITMQIFKGTRSKIDELKDIADYEQDAELFLWLVNNAHRIIKRDMSQSENLIGINK